MRTKKINVILVGPAPPAVGGVAAINEVITKTFHNLKYNVILLNTAKYRFKNKSPIHGNRARNASHLSADQLIRGLPKEDILLASQAGSLCYGIGQTTIISFTLLFFQVLLLLKFLNLLIKSDNSIVHIAITSYTAFYRSALFVIFSIMFNKKKVLHVHGGAFERFYDRGGKIQQNFIRFIFQKADCVIALSDCWKNFLVKKIRVPQQKVEVVYNCYSLDLIYIDDVKNKVVNEKKRDTFELLFMGSLGKNKGVFDLFEICKELKQSRYNFVLNLAGGEGEQGLLRKARNIIDEYGLNEHVKLLGEVKDFQKLYYFSKCDLFILPSYVENFPVVIPEAMRAGLPIVTTPVGAIAEIFQDGENGYLVKPGEIELFADKILQLIEHQNIRQVMSKTNMKQAINKFDPLIYSKELRKIYDKVLWHTEIT